MRKVALAAAGAVLVLGGCEALRPPAAPVAPTISVATLYQRPAERSLILGLSLYEQAQFDQAEQAFRNALKTGLRDSRDTATAYKHLAFIDCAFKRLKECEADFRAALQADPDFRLTDAEVGHPIWGPVYKSVLASVPRPAAPPK
jgi:Tfp pilus assembly protein PilF